MEYTHVITDAITGEVTIIPFTQAEIEAHKANQTAEPQVSKDDLLAKLAALQMQIASLED